ncbi:MAG: AAA family ATPase, partial [Tannerella sp.]|nr:AAA family ATPase [Tannerella sp.]
MESFYRIHKYLLSHLYSPVRRGLMDEINWDDRLIGIKGSRGVGKTTFLLSYANEFFGADNKECLYINLNHFFFTERTLIDFATEFRAQGGKVLLIDQVFKYPNWSKELRYCYDHFTDLRIVFTGSSVMRLREENPDLSGKVKPYYLRGFSFREYLNLMTGNAFPAYSFEDVINNHVPIAKEICAVTKPRAYFQDYLHHG